MLPVRPFPSVWLRSSRAALPTTTMPWATLAEAVDDLTRWKSPERWMLSPVFSEAIVDLTVVEVPRTSTLSPPFGPGTHSSSPPVRRRKSASHPACVPPVPIGRHKGTEDDEGHCEWETSSIPALALSREHRPLARALRP